ncbi:tetratricopeptide (TPR) repeat protein [Ochrobactrum sp. 19YEA23]|uniref:tetratricopeptide repeat protein n=1 Tax=Ochrobactrum sp. 19YEA23 TaxID=3039854 RepID=UPI00247A1A31|nr:tetratricopeptide (TPR) repeat protein [Ochrobactrum sp. 19YEA23]
MTVSQTQIKPPANWQDFESASVVLWGDILQDDGIHRFGRGGQAQYGLDLMGYRDGDPNRLVGVQCKCIDLDNELDETTVREEVGKAVNSGFPLTEYFITHTGKNDGKLDRLATELTADLAKDNRRILIRVWGWGTVRERISRSEKATLAFDPTYSPFAASIKVTVEEGNRTVLESIEQLTVMVSDRFPSPVPFDPTASGTAGEEPLDREIDRYRIMIEDGRPVSALKLLEGLWGDLDDNTSGRIRFRVRANIGHCRIQLGDELHGAEDLLAASELWPDNEKSTSNKILALLLLNRFSEAREMASSASKSYPASGIIAAYLIQSWRDPGLDGSVLDQVPEGLHESEEVVVNYVDHLRFHERIPEWWNAANAALAKFPDNRQIQLAAADATVDQSVRKLRDWIKLSDEEIEAVRAASDVLGAEYEKIKRHDCPGRQDHRAYIANYVISLCTAGDFEAAGMVVTEALTFAPDDQSFITLAAQVGFEINDNELQDRAFLNLKREGTPLLLACQIAARRSGWDFLRGVTADEVATLLEHEQGVISALIRTAKAKNAGPDQARQIAEWLVVDTKNDIRASIVAAGLAKDLGLQTLEDQAFSNAVNAISETTGYAARTMVAHFAMRKDLYGIVIGILDSHVDARHHSLELAILASAHAHAVPSRASGAKFFDSLSQSLRESARYLRLEGIYHYRSGNVDRAQEVLHALLDLKPNSCDAILLLAQAQGRKARSYTPIIDLMKPIDIEKLKGRPLEKVQVAQILQRVGRIDDAIRLGYAALQDGREDPATNLHFAGLIFMTEHAEVLNPPSTVQEGTWVEITGPKGETNSFLIEDGPDRPSARIYGLSHQYAKQTLSCAIGHEFTVDHPSGKQTWRITQIKSCYLHAFHDVIEHFNDRFPEHPGFWKMTTHGDDISELLAVVRRQGEDRDRQLRAYSEKSIPMQLMAGHGNVIQFMETVRATGGEIKTCQGTALERDRTLRWVDEHKSSGAVLDTLTFWTVADLEAVDVLKAVFGRVVVARPTSDDISELKNELVYDGNRKSGTTSYYKGQFSYTENTPETAKAASDLIGKREALFKSDVEVVPVLLRDNPSLEFEEVIAKVGIEVMAPALVAAMDQMLLVSDDLSFRVLARHTCKVPVAWLQAVFMYAYKSGIIGVKRYSDIVAGLAARRHGFVSVDPAILEVAVPATDARVGEQFFHLVEYLGSKDADMKSHLKVTVAFLSSIWDRSPIGLAEMSATGLLLEKITRFTGGDTELLLRWFDGEVGDLRFREYLRRWVRGHFLPFLL